MAKFVELIGPSGVGKSSLYFELQRQWKESDEWVLFHDFKYKRRSWSPEAILLKLKSIFYSVSSTDYFWHEGKIVDQKKEFAVIYPEFVSTFLDLIHEHTKYGFNGQDKRFQVIFFMLKSIDRVHQVLEDTTDNRVCLIDEGLISRLMHLNSPSFTENDVDRYLRSMPLPDAILYVNTLADEIVKRIQKRKKTSTIHIGLTKQEILEITKKTQRLIEYSFNQLERKGVTILHLDASRSVKTLAKDSIDFLVQVSKKTRV